MIASLIRTKTVTITILVGSETVFRSVALKLSRYFMRQKISCYFLSSIDLNLLNNQYLIVETCGAEFAEFRLLGISGRIT